MAKQLKKQTKKNKIFLAILAIAFASSVLVSTIGTFATYPTATHRTAARELTAYSDKAFSSGAADPNVFETAEYKKLNESHEAKYSLIATFVNAGLGFVATVIVIAYIYVYLRRHRVTTHPVAATTLLYTAGVVLSTIATLFISNAYLGQSPPSAVSILISSLFIASFGLLVDYVIVRIVHWRYNRKYSFVED